MLGASVKRKRLELEACKIDVEQQELQLKQMRLKQDMAALRGQHQKILSIDSELPDGGPSGLDLTDVEERRGDQQVCSFPNCKFTHLPLITCGICPTLLHHVC